MNYVQTTHSKNNDKGGRGEKRERKLTTEISFTRMRTLRKLEKVQNQRQEYEGRNGCRIGCFFRHENSQRRNWEVKTKGEVTRPKKKR